MRALLALVLLMSLAVPPAAAQIFCGDRATMIDDLIDRYGESRHGTGLWRSEIVEIWTSDTTGTWTILKTYPNGQSCQMAEGQNWQHDPPLAVGDPI